MYILINYIHIISQYIYIYITYYTPTGHPTIRMVPLFKARPPATELRRLSELLGASSCIASVVTCPVPLSSCAELEAELATEAGTGGRDDGQMWFGSVFFLMVLMI